MIARTIRYALTIFLLTFVYFETGWATTLALALSAIAHEMTSRKP